MNKNVYSFNNDRQVTVNGKTYKHKERVINLVPTNTTYTITPHSELFYRSVKYVDYFKGFESTIGVAEMFEIDYTCYFKLKSDASNF
jgi:hypothetical protein